MTAIDFEFGPTLKAGRKTITHDARGLKLRGPIDGVEITVGDGEHSNSMFLTRDEALMFAGHVTRICQCWTHGPDNDYFLAGDQMSDQSPTIKCLSVRRTDIAHGDHAILMVQVALDDKVIHLELAKAKAIGEALIMLSKTPANGMMVSSAL